MKTRETIEEELARLTQGHYYSEDYDFEWAAKAYYDGLDPEGRGHLEGILIQRLSGEPDISDVALCARLGLSSLTPFLAACLDGQSASSAMTRALLAALSNQPDARAFESVERFMDSEQEGEALLCLARMDFHRALPHLRRAVREDHLHNFCLHALHEFKGKAGFEALVDAVRMLVEPDRFRIAPHARKILTSKRGQYNPFSAEELESLLGLLT